MGERGISHIEVLLSFLIFVGFVIFALYFFSPTQTSRLINSSLSYAMRDVSERVSIGLFTYPVKIAPRRGNINVIEIEIKEDIPKDMEIRVENYNGEDNILAERVEVNENDNNEKIHFELDNKLYKKNKDEGFAFLKFSEDFVPSDEDKLKLWRKTKNPMKEANSYEVGAAEKKEVVSEKRVRELKKSYDNDYNKLKEDFKLPKTVNFEFALFGDKIEIEAKKDSPASGNIAVSSRRVEVLQIDGTVVFADLKVRIR